MPNVLAHYGAHGIATHLLFRGIGIRWVLVSCLLPDVPWILLRVLRQVALPLDPYDLRLYAIAQASLVFTLVLCSACALFSSRPRKVLAVLILGTLAHLLFDALQTKWGNGVHLLAPFSWRLLNVGLFWPESLVTTAFTMTGSAFGLWVWFRVDPLPLTLHRIHRLRLAWAAGFLSLYFVAPRIFMDSIEASDTHFVATLRDREARAGRFLELDRVRYRMSEAGPNVITFSGELLHVKGVSDTQDGLVSLRGVFVDRQTIRVENWHRHHPWGRDIASYVGLFLLAAVIARDARWFGTVQWYHRRRRAT